jgi:hypothetical protein
MITSRPCYLSYVNPDLSHFCVVVLNTSSPSDSVDSLEERFVKAKSSMVASTIPKSLLYHEKKDAYYAGPEN